jgi:hypothetical protein
MQCLNCTYSTDKLSELNRHQHEHKLRKNGSFKCFPCGLIFNNYRVFKVHQNRKHPPNQCNPQIPPNPAVQKTFFCKKCTFSTESIHNLFNHTQNIHFSKGQDIECCLCLKKLFTKGNFKTHFRRAHRIPPENRTVVEQLSAPIQTFSNSFDGIPTHHEQQQQQQQPNQQQQKLSIEQILVQLFLKLKAKYGVIEEVIQIFYEELKHIIDFFAAEVLENVGELPQSIRDAFQPKFSNIQSRFKFTSLGSAYKRKKAFEKYLGLVSPQTIELGKNDDHDDCSYQYVPIEKSLKSLLSENEVFQKVVQKKPFQENIYHDYNDGDAYKSKNESNIIANNEIIIELIVFSDAFGLCNAISAKSSKYKLNGFYYIIGNFNQMLRSTIDTIQLISLCNEKHIKYFGWNNFTKHMVAELKNLETKGFNIESVHFKVKLISIAGDNLGSHALGGFVENFSKVKYFCRFCYITQDQLASKNVHLCERRTPENYALDVQAKQEDATNFKGLKFDSPFNELNAYHVCDPGLPPCIGHDLFHGVFSRDLQMAINKLVELNIFTISFLNAILRRFVKMYRNFNSFPKLCTKNKKLKGSMSEISKIILVMPHILLHAPEGHEDLRKYVLTMYRITQIVTAPSISTDQIVILDEEIEEYFRLRLLLFPDATLQPKHHFLKHYVELIRLFGPLSKFSTLPFEHKHQYFKNMIMHTKNFINAPKTLAERHQLYQSLLKNDRFQTKILSNSAQLYDPAIFNIEVSHEFKFITRVATYNHQKFAEQDLIVFGFNRNSLSIKVMDIKFMLIDETFNKLLFLGPIAQMILNSETELYEPNTEFTAKYSIVSAEELLIFKPVYGYKFKNQLHISLPYTFPIIY